MKIIELLNKIANGEEVPKKIKYCNVIYTYNNDGDYCCGDSDEYYNDYLLFPQIKDVKYFLNDEVEILEEEKKIPEKLSTWFSVETKQSKELNIEYANTNFENMYEKVNEIINYLDYLKSKGE